MELRGDGFLLRPWRAEDAASLVKHANNRKIARNLTGTFPHPYTPADAQEWLSRCGQAGCEEDALAIEIDAEAVGGMGILPRKDGLGEHAVSLGYWLGEPYWGRGIMSRAFPMLVERAFAREGVLRLQAGVFGWNPASARVLEKAGFTLEGRLRQAVCRFGEYTDLLLYGRLRSDQ